MSVLSRDMFLKVGVRGTLTKFKRRFRASEYIPAVLLKFLCSCLTIALSSA